MDNIFLEIMNSGRFVWLAQRITATILIPLIVWLIICLINSNNLAQFGVLEI